MAYGSREEYAVLPRWLKQRVATWMRRMGIDKEWNVTLHFQDRVSDGGPAISACTTWAEGYQSADIYFAKPYYDKMSEHDFDVLVCHELYHLVHAREDDQLSDDIGREHVYKRYAKEAERAADKFANMFVRAYSRRREDK
jgi:hypothetical protein